MTGAGSRLTNCSAGSLIHTSPCADCPQILFCLFCCCCCFPWENFKPIYGFWLSWNCFELELTAYADNLSYTCIWLLSHYSCDSKSYTIYTAFLSWGFPQEAWGLTANWFPIKWDCFRSLSLQTVLFWNLHFLSHQNCSQRCLDHICFYTPLGSHGKPTPSARHAGQTCFFLLDFTAASKALKLSKWNQN